MIKSSKDFGRLVREKRKALGWTQAELAERAGTGERFVVELEAGKPTCHLEKALIVARTVKLQIDDLGSAHPAPQQDGGDLDFLPRFP